MPEPPVASLPARVVRHLADTGLFDPPGRVLLAVSGGGDSLALLYLLADAAPGLGVTLTVGHVDHGLHPESAAWAARVRTAADRLGVPVLERRLALEAGTSETRARAARYKALRAMREEAGAAYVATAHHADDQRETVLFRVLRGSGPAGLAGIPARGPGGLRRPLLPFTRGELRAWLASAHPDCAPVADPANRDERHDRVWIRHHLLPVLEGRFPDVATALDGLAAQARSDRVAWEALLRSLPELRFAAGPHHVEVERAPFSEYDKTLSGALLRALSRLAGGRLRARRVPAFLHFLRDAPSGRSFDVGEGVRALSVFGRVRLVRAETAVTSVAPLVLGGAERGEARWGAWGITWQREAAGATTRAAWTTWITGSGGEVRGLERGDVLEPLGGVGRRRVRRLLMEARVPGPDRATYPLLVRDGAVLWVPGVCRAAAAVPRPGAGAMRVDVRRREA